MNVRVYATLRPIVGGKEADLAIGPGDTFRQMIDEMLVRWPGLQRELFDAKGELPYLFERARRALSGWAGYAHS